MKSKRRVACVYLIAASALVMVAMLRVHATDNSVGGNANGCTVNSTVTVLGVSTVLTLNSAAPVTLPSTGGNLTNTIAAVGVGVPAQSVLQTGAITNATSGTLGVSSAHAESISTVNGLNILNGLVTADTIVAKSTSDGNGTSAASTSAGSSVTNLLVAGVAVTGQPAPNTVISITAYSVGLVTVSGTVTLNEQTATGNATTTSGLTVRQIHVQVSGSSGSNSVTADVVVAIASSNVDFTAPTVVDLISFSAKTGNDGYVRLRWQTGYEAENLGFNIYREDPNGKLTRLTPNVIAGSAFMVRRGTPLTAGLSYSWSDPEPGNAQMVRYWLEDLDLNGERTWHGPYGIEDSQTLSPSSGNASSITINALNAQQEQGETYQTTGQVERTARLKLAGVGKQADLAGGPAVKLSVRREAWYRVSQPELVEAGLDASVDPRRLQLFVDGQELPMLVQGEKDGRFDPADSIEFYGQGLDTPSTDARVYWLVAGSQPALRIKQFQGVGVASPSGGFPYTVQRKDRLYYFSNIKNGEAESFFGAFIYSQPTEQLMNVTHIAPATDATIEFAMQGFNAGAHSVEVSVNGAIIGTLKFSDQAHSVNRLTFPQSLLVEGSNAIRLVARAGSSDFSFVDYIRLTYAHKYMADGDALRLSALSTAQLTIGGFSSPRIRVVDVTGGAPIEISGSVTQEKDGYAIMLGLPGYGPRNLLAFTENRIEHPASISANQPSTWRQVNHQADIVIITRRDFTPALQPLVALRQSQGMSVASVYIDDIYDEFSYGHKNPAALKNFLTYAAFNWRTAPRFVLLVGDASFDPRNYLGRGDWDIVPTKIIQTDNLKTASDDSLADFDGDNLADMAVGRLPVRTTQEATALVSKIVGYDRTIGINRVLLVADRNERFDFEGAATQLRSLIPASLTVTDIRRGQIGDSKARSQLLDAINQGSKITTFYGHGSPTVWTNGAILAAEDAGSFVNAEHLSLFIDMTCLNGYFHDVSTDSLGESLLKARGGAIAVWASSGITTPTAQTVLSQEAIRQLLLRSGLTIGEALGLAKAAVGDTDVRRTWILLGDPSTRLK